MFFPFMADVSGQKLLIVGGGTVAFRKFELFHDFGAAVTVVAPELSPLFRDHEGEFTYIRDIYRREYLAGAMAAVAASDDRDVNALVAAHCREERILVNSVDDPENCSFIVPAVLRRGDLTVAVSTAGKSPTLAGQIKRELEKTYGEDYARRLDLLGRLRERVKAAVDDPAARRKILTQAADWDEEQLRDYLAR